MVQFIVGIKDFDHDSRAYHTEMVIKQKCITGFFQGTHTREVLFVPNNRAHLVEVLGYADRANVR